MKTAELDCGVTCPDVWLAGLTVEDPAGVVDIRCPDRGLVKLAVVDIGGGVFVDSLCVDSVYAVVELRDTWRALRVEVLS